MQIDLYIDTAWIERKGILKEDKGKETWNGADSVYELGEIQSATTAR